MVLSSNAGSVIMISAWIQLLLRWHKLSFISRRLNVQKCFSVPKNRHCPCWNIWILLTPKIYLQR